MEFLEKDLEQIIWETDVNVLSERGLYIEGKMYRQLKIGNYGIADLVTFAREGIGPDSFIHFTVYELKKDNVGIAAFMQAYSYVKGISEYLKSRGFKFSFSVVLIGKRIDTSGSFCYLPDLISNLYMATYSFNINGLTFNQVTGYSLINSGLAYEQKGLD